MQYQSWDGLLTKWYEKNLGLDGGFARRISKYNRSSITNSEYVKSTPYGLKVVARSGKRLPKPVYNPKEFHYGHTYGNPNLIREKEKTQLRKKYRLRKQRELRRRIRR